jgi:hypothetical protein
MMKERTIVGLLLAIIGMALLSLGCSNVEAQSKARFVRVNTDKLDRDTTIELVMDTKSRRCWVVYTRFGSYGIGVPVIAEASC